MAMHGKIGWGKQNSFLPHNLSETGKFYMGQCRMGHDEAVNLTSEKHDPCAQISHLHKRRKQKYLAEGTGVEPAKYPPKVKLEIFSQL